MAETPRGFVPAYHGEVYDAEDLEVPASFVLNRLEEHDEHVLVNLAEGERAWNPASTKRPLYGPMQLKYTGGTADGGVTCTIIAPSHVAHIESPDGTFTRPIHAPGIKSAYTHARATLQEGETLRGVTEYEPDEL